MMQSEQLVEKDTDIKDSEATKECQLHKISPLFILFDNIKKLILPALVALVGSKSSSWEYFALGGAALISIISIVQYRFYRYWLQPEKIKVKEGIFFRNVREVDYKRIQNLNLVQNPLHKIFGVAKVQLESASGGKPEAIINVIDINAVKELRGKIHSEDLDFDEKELINNSETEKEEQSAVAPILQLGFGDIVRYGIISNRGLIVVAIFFGFMGQFFDGASGAAVKSAINKSADVVGDAISSIIPETSSVIMVIYFIFIFIISLALLWALSIGMAWFKFHGFTIKDKNKRLNATMGLLTNISATIPMSRIQALTIHNSWLHKFFSRVTVTVETAGGVNNEQHGITMKHIAPLLKSEGRVNFLSQVQNDVNWKPIEWTLIEQRAWRRLFKVKMIIYSLVLLTTILYSIYLYLGLLVGAAIWSYIYSKAYVKNTGYYLGEDVLGFKSGVIFHKETYVRLPKVQTAKVKESPFDRRNKMASVEVDTAGAALGAHHIDIPYLNFKDAQLIHQFIISRVKNIQFEW